MIRLLLSNVSGEITYPVFVPSLAVKQTVRSSTSNVSHKCFSKLLFYSTFRPFRTMSSYVFLGDKDWWCELVSLPCPKYGFLNERQHLLTEPRVSVRLYACEQNNLVIKKITITIIHYLKGIETYQIS